MGFPPLQILTYLFHSFSFCLLSWSNLVLGFVLALMDGGRLFLLIPSFPTRFLPSLRGRGRAPVEPRLAFIPGSATHRIYNCTTQTKTESNSVSWVTN